MMDARDRLFQIIDFSKLTDRAFALSAGLIPQNIYDCRKLNRVPSLEMVQKVLKVYPEIRVEWFVMGEGEMFDRDKLQIRELKQIVDDLSKK